MNDRLARIQGVGDLEVLGPREYSMRIWINPDKLSKYNMSPATIVRALREQNKQVAAGAEPREALGTSVLYGMIGVTFLGLIFTPAFYYAIQRNKKYAVKDTE